MPKQSAYLVVITVLISSLLLSACGSFSPTPRVNRPGPTSTANSIPGTGKNGDENAPVTVADQSYDGTTVIVSRVISQGPGWMAIHTQENGSIGPVIGYQHVNSGENDNVAVKIDPQKAAPVLYAMLHTDAGKVGVYEFPGPDVPVMVNGAMIAPSFHATIAKGNAGPAASLSIRDQDVSDGVVMIDQVTSLGPGWVAISTQNPDGTPGKEIGYQAVQNGPNTNVTVKIDASKATPVLIAILHADAGDLNTYEYPGPDVPQLANGRSVESSFKNSPTAAQTGGGATGTPAAGAASGAAATPAASAGAAPVGGAPGGAASSLSDAQKAVIRIVAEGTYQYPDNGAVQELGSGSGFLISPDGIAVTNNHVVTGAGRLKVYFSDNQRAYNARILGVSECSDLAVIQIQGDAGQTFPYLQWYADKPRLGLKVYSLGYPLGDPNLTQHGGAISKEQSDGNTSWTAINSVLEHDAIISPGNSGGPLLTDAGQVVGINYAINGQYSQYYAIPAASATNVVKQLQGGSNVDSIGINGEAMSTKDKSLSGVWVYSVQSGSQADKAGIQAGDFLLELEGITLGRDGTMADYCDVLRTHKPGDTLTVKLARLKSGVVMEGEINGRQLQATQNLTQSGSSTAEATSAAAAGETPQATGQAPDFFTEEFNGDLSNWSYFHFGKDNAKFTVNGKDGKLVFDIQDPNTYVYLTYDPYTYQDVRLDATVLNQADTNLNNFSLFCRYDSKLGWYEFNVTSGGLWNILRYDAPSNQYIKLYDGGSTNINMGMNSNIFGLACSGNDISVYINNKLVRTVTDKHFTEGLIGISASSFDNVPVTISFDKVVISQP